MVLLSVICVVIILILYSWISILKNRQGHNVKGPFPLPVIGNAHLFVVSSSELSVVSDEKRKKNEHFDCLQSLQDGQLRICVPKFKEFLNLLKSLSQRYGDPCIVYYLSLPYVVLLSSKYIEPVVMSTELITKGQSYNFMRPWLGNGLLTATGQRWKNHRKFLTPAFHFNILQNFLPVFCKNGRILTDKLDQLADGQIVNLFPIVALAALDNVTEAIMGLSVDSQKNAHSEYVKSIAVVAEILSRRMQIPFLAIDFIFNFTADKKKQDAAIKVLHTHTKNVMAARRRDLKEMNITSLEESNDLGIKNRYAFLDLLLLGEVDGVKIDEESIREEVDTFMFEGHDTTTSGICYNLYCISKYPDVQTKILQEQENIFGEDMDRDPTFTELSKMKYLELVIKESLRIYPSVPLIERKVTRDTEVGELKVKKGTTLVINIFQMQRDPTLFKEPLEFRPERFEAFSPETKNACSFLAFSAGPRNCIGQRFAMMEMKVTLSQIVRRFRVLPVDEEPELCADLILKSKNGVKVKLLKR